MTLSALLVAACLSVSTAPALAAGAESSRAPLLDAAAWVLVDARSGDQLAGQAESRARPIASATKLMTAFVALEQGNLNQTLTAPGYDALAVESVLGLQKGERISLDNALVAMLLPSANDVAVAVAKGLAGSTGRFVERMNEAAAELGMSDSSFTNPIGLDAPGHLSSARDLATLTLALRRFKRFREIVDQSQAVVSTDRAERPVLSRNSLLGIDPSINGVKTGFTLGAGYVLVGSAERDRVPLVSVVLGAPSEAARDAATLELLEYGFSLYGERRAVRADEELASVQISHSDDDLALVASRGVSVQAREDQSLRVAVDAPGEVEGPLTAGASLGTATISLDGERIDRVRLLAAQGVAAPSLIDDVGGSSSIALILVGLGAAILLVVLMARRRGDVQTVSGRTPEDRIRQRERRRRRRHGDVDER